MTPFSALLTARLAARHLTPRSLAAHIGVSRQCVSSWLRGATAPRPARWPHLAATLRCSTRTISDSLTPLTPLTHRLTQGQTP